MSLSTWGYRLRNAGTRVGHLEETLQLMKLLFTEETVNFSGKYYTITEMKGNIRPVQHPHPPLLVAGAGERMLKLAAREANIIAIGSKIGKQGIDPTDATLEQKIAWIKEAAGQRLADLELSQTIYDLEITDSGTALPSQTGAWSIPKRPLTTEQAVAHLLEQRDRYGFSYLQISGRTDGELCSGGCAARWKVKREGGISMLYQRRWLTKAIYSFPAWVRAANE